MNVNKKSGAKQIFEEYAKSSTIHGFSRIVDVKLYKGRRILWTIVVLMMWLALVVLVYKEVTEYLSNQTFTSIQSRIVRPQDLPAVSICDPNYLKTILVEDMEQTDRIRILRGMDFLKEWDIQSNDTNSVSNTSQSHRTSESHSNQTDAIVPALVKKMNSHRNLDLFNLKCSWGEQWRSCKKAFTTSVSMYGICLTMNPRTIVNTKNTQPKLLTTLRGLRYIYKQPNISSAEVEFKGVKVIIHDANEDPLSTLRGFYVHSGTFAEISITKTESRNLPLPYESFGGSGCVDSEQSQITRFLKYSRSSCELECFMNYTISRCGCRHFLFKGMERLCSLQEMEDCIAVKAVDYFNGRELSSCNCFHACIQSSYLVTLSSLEKPSEDKTISFHIFFGNSLVTEITQKNLHNMESFLANIGGIIGLFLGFSVVSLIEIIELCVYFVAKHCTKSRIGNQA